MHKVLEIGSADKSFSGTNNNPLTRSRGSTCNVHSKPNVYALLLGKNIYAGYLNMGTMGNACSASAESTFEHLVGV